VIFLTYFKNHWKLFLLDILCAMCIAGIDLSFPLVTRSALYDMLPGQMYKTFFTVMMIVLCCYVLRSVLNFIVAYFGHTFGIRVEADIRKDLFAHMQTLSFDFYDQNRTGQLMSRLTTDLFELTELAHHGPEDLLTSILTIIGALIVMFTIRWELAVVVLCVIPVFLIVVMTMRRSMSRASKASKEKTGHINQEIESSLSGVRTAKAFANEKTESARFGAANEIYKTSKREFHKAMGRFHSSVEFFLCSLNVIIIGIGGYFVMEGEMDHRDLLTFTLYISSFVGPMRKLSGFSEMFANGFAGLNRFVSIMRTEPTIQDKPDAKVMTDVKGAISVKDVTFAYDGDLDVLHGVSLEVQPGETIAIVGPSGGGKSTLCQLIPRFYEVSEGSISIDGLDIRDAKQHSLHQNIGIVQQDVFLFADTIFENIRYGRPDATMEEVIEAAKKAEIYDDILAMPAGFETYVGERGTLLSGGQKQRVAIARIFLKNPPILILDEATSALDSVTEAKIQRAFDTLAKGRTTLIIAHRLSTIRSANRIISIADGIITECGTHAELLERGGIYADLYTTQNALALEAMKG
jgi:ATP-binding cassette subfamily B protein